MSEKEVLLTKEGLKKLEDELEYLKSVKRREVAQRIKEARDFGDISENSEYEEAKNEQAFVEGRIITLEKTLRNARIVDNSEADPTTVVIGSKVKLLDLEYEAEEEYYIVGSTEANPEESKISYMSPVGQALMGHRAGEIVEIKLPMGLVKYKIVSVNR